MCHLVPYDFSFFDLNSPNNFEPTKKTQNLYYVHPQSDSGQGVSLGYYIDFSTFL